jgi:hypothetical protein
MFSEDTIQELQKALQKNNGQCQVEIEGPTGQTFTVHLQEGRAQALQQQRQRQSQQGQGQGTGTQQSFQAQSQQEVQEWRVRKIPNQQQSQQY